MQGRRQNQDSFFGSGDPFAEFGGQRSLLSDFLGRRGDPFDDPFFTRPFGSMFESNSFGPRSSLFPDAPSVGFTQNQQPRSNKQRGPIIEEINSDEENEENGEERKSKHVQLRSENNKMNKTSLEPQHRMNNKLAEPRSQSFSFYSSSVSYGGANGAYYTKSSTRRTGGDGVTFEEHKEADSSTGQAAHRVSRGLHDKGHTLSRKLNSDGRVDSMEMLHNLNEDELAGFEEAWKGKAKNHLPGLSDRIAGLGSNGSGTDTGTSGQTGKGGWALPSSDQLQ